jgi:hypothetical protein
VRIDGAEDLLEVQREILQFVMEVGRNIEQQVFEQAGQGYEGAEIEREGRRYRFVSYRQKEIHGLFGRIRYQRAYYSCIGAGGGYVPLDLRLGIDKEHTPGLQYFLSTFTGREAYEESLGRFHEIFRPDGRQLISLRKALDMNYELGDRLEQIRQQEVAQVFDEDRPIAAEEEIKTTMAVSIDATKVRHKEGESRSDDGTRSYEIGFRDAKIAAVSRVGWDGAAREAFCTDSSYVGAIEHADEFFRRIWVEMIRRGGDPTKKRIVFLADGATWIWDRIPDLANVDSVLVLDFYHACEHVSKLCKELYGEQTPEYWERFRCWKHMLLEGKAPELVRQLKELRDNTPVAAHRKAIQQQLNYFENNLDKMRYDRYIAMKLPIGSGTIESGCKNVIGKRLKQGGMTWSHRGAQGMVQIRCSIASGRLLRDFREILPIAA